MEDKIETIVWTSAKKKIRELRPWTRNPRMIMEDEAKRLRESLDEFGQALPFLIGPDGELYDGHQREKVWNLPPDTEVDVRISNRPLTEKEREKLSIYLEKAKGEWDFEVLANEFEVDELLEWGFEEWELGIVPERPGSKENEDPGTLVSKADALRMKYGTEPDQLWILGDHKLYIGDSTDPGTIDLLFEGDDFAGAVISDPPYGIGKVGVENDEESGIRELYAGALAVLPIEDGPIIVTLSPRLEYIWTEEVKEAGHKLERLLWLFRKAGKTFPWRGWVLASDAIRISSVGSPDWNDPVDHSYDTYVKEVLEPRELDGLHSTLKPLDVFIDLVDHTSGIVFDGFAGSGTTLIACQKLGRASRVVELSPEYSAVILERYYNETGIKPVLSEISGPGSSSESALIIEPDITVEQ